MQTWMMSPVYFSCCLLLAVIIGTSIVYGEPEPMARPTRPKVFGSPEELKKYVDLVRDYYFLIGKARYGKRGDIAPMSMELNSAWEILRMIQDARRQYEQRRQEKIRQNKEQLLFRDFQSSDIDKHISHAARPGPLSDMIDNYDDVQ